MHAVKLQKTIGYTFKNPDRLREALTHPSLAHEKGEPPRGHNQRLEFLGDAVLQVVLTDRIYKLYPESPEGDLTQTRARLANRHTLWRRARAIDLGKHLLLGKGEEGNGGRDRLSNLADAYEALIGAIYLDGGLRAVRKFILTEFAGEFRDLKESSPSQNPKGHLQELLQTRSSANPVYRVIQESGPDHHKYFEVTVEWQGRELARGNGSSKKQAEIAAAERALQALVQNDDSAAPTVPVALQKAATSPAAGE